MSEKSRRMGKTGLGIGFGVFFAVVTTTLAALHAAKPNVDRFADPLPDDRTVYVCKSAPDWAKRHVTTGVGWLNERRSKFGTVVFNDDCSQFCPWENSRGAVIEVACHPGAVTVDLMTMEQLTATLDSDGPEVERVFYGKKGGRLEWVNVSFAPDISQPVDMGGPGEAGELPSMLPKDVDAMIVTHGLAHTDGYGHSYTRLLGSSKVIANKTGELMNPAVESMGWGDGGFPDPK